MKRIPSLVASVTITAGLCLSSMSPACADDADSGVHPFRSAKHFMMLEGAALAGHAILSHESLGDSINDQMLRTPGLSKMQVSIQDDAYLASGAVALAGLAPNTPEGRQANNILRAVLSRHPNVGMGILAKVVTEFAASSVSYRPPAVALAQSLNMPFDVYRRAMATADEQARAQRAQQAILADKLAKGDLISEENDPDCSTKGVDLNGAYAEIDESVPALASERRNKTSGYASGGENLPYIGFGTQWFYEDGDFSYAPIPRQVADALRGRKFSNFDSFRKAIWVTVYRNPTLITAGNFTLNDVALMRNGKAPRRDTKAPYNLHHIVPIHAFGQVYGFDNLLISKASCHRKIHQALEQ